MSESQAADHGHRNFFKLAGCGLGALALAARPSRASAQRGPGAGTVRAFSGISYRRVGPIAHRQGGLVGVPIAGDDRKAIAIAEQLIRDIGSEPVLVGGPAMGKYLLPGTPLAEEHSPAELRRIAAGAAL